MMKETKMDEFERRARERLTAMDLLEPALTSHAQEEAAETRAAYKRGVEAAADDAVHGEDGRTRFDVIHAAILDEAKWLAELHGGSSRPEDREMGRADARTLRDLADHVARVSEKLGFGRIGT